MIFILQNAATDEALAVQIALIHDIDIVAAAADHDVGASLAVKDIVPVSTYECVVVPVADQRVVTGTAIQHVAGARSDIGDNAGSGKNHRLQFALVEHLGGAVI